MSYLERAKAEFKEQEEQDKGLVANLLDIPVGAVSGMINAANAVADLPGDVGNLLGILSEEEAKEFNDKFNFPNFDPREKLQRVK